MPKQEPTPSLSPAVFHILLALATDEMHGYAIMQEVEAISDGHVRIGPGTLYGALKRLVEQGLIEESQQRPAPDLDDERRRYYKLTAAGAEVVSAEAARMARLVQVARKRKLLPRPVPGAAPA